jgi:riboflavin kinase/FMN adenylyltransferase
MLKIFRSLDELPADFGPSVVTIGNFDGVHCGHRKILELANRLALRNGWRTATLTFDPHPLQVVAPERAPRLMTTIEQRREVLESTGVDAMVVLPFTKEFSTQSPEEFVEQVLVRGLRCACVVVGENFRFGHRHAGDIDTLEKLGRRYGFVIEAVGPFRIGGQTVSSSRIRAAVTAGRIDVARRLLGRPFELAGEVVPGRGIGSKSTAPTLNLNPQADLWPANGVYVSETRELSGPRRWRSVTNVGVRPTFGESDRVVETHLLDPLEGASPTAIAVGFLRRLRDERPFESSEALREQIYRDIAKSERYFRLRDKIQAHGV